MPKIVREVTVGRSNVNHIAITSDEYVNLYHCVLRQDETGAVWVEDLGSTNGTWILYEGRTDQIQVVLPMQIRPGDVLIVGATRIPWTKK